MKWKGWTKEPIWGKEVWNGLYCVRICLQRQGSFQLCGIKALTKWETNRPWRGVFNFTLKVIWLCQLWMCGQTLLYSDLSQDFTSASFLGPGGPVCCRYLVSAFWIWGGVWDTLIYSPSMTIHRGERWFPKRTKGCCYQMNVDQVPLNWEQQILPGLRRWNLVPILNSASVDVTAAWRTLGPTSHVVQSSCGSMTSQ